MFNKIRYRFVYNKRRKMNRDGRSVVQIELLLNGRRVYFSTKVYLFPHEWDGYYVINHPLATELNRYLFNELIKIQRIEFSFIEHGKNPTLKMMKNAVRNNINVSATFHDFTLSINKHASSRGKHTKDSYVTLVKIVDRFQKDTTLEDIDLDWLNRFVDWQKAQKMSQSTISGRLKGIRCILNEAIARKLLNSDDSPFLHFKIPKIKNREEALTFDEIIMLMNLKLKKREKHIRDVFVFDCLCGLRYSDLNNLHENSFQSINGKKWIILHTQKTGERARVPIETIFNGLAWKILNSYRSIESFSKIGNNASANRTLKEVFLKAGIHKYAHFHLARHTFITLCIEEGIPITTVQLMAAHAKLETTRGYAKLGISSIAKDVEKAFIASSVSMGGTDDKK